MCKSKKALYSSFYEDELFLDFGISAYFTLFEFDFINITLDNYSQIKTENSKVLLFMVVFNTVLIKHKVFNSEKRTTKVAVLKLWLVYYILSIQIHC